MSSPYDYYERGTYTRRRRGLWGHWVPLVLTVTVATVGVAAWVWSQRRGSDEHEEEPDPAYQDLDYENADYGDNPPYGATGPRVDSNTFDPNINPDINDPAAAAAAAAAGARPPSYGGGEIGYGTAMREAQIEQGAGGGSAASGWGAQMSGALRRTPSPQQFLDSARKTVAAGMSAVGSALAAIREEDKGAYADHETWSEEADAKKTGAASRSAAAAASGSGARREKKVAIVVSADAHVDDESEHASILSHIPRQNDSAGIRLYVLIYAPGLKDMLPDSTGNAQSPSLSSSYSNIEQPNQSQTPGEETNILSLAAASDSAFSTVYSQARALVGQEADVLPFTTPNGHTHLLRHLQPDIIYLQESLAGANGGVITQLQTWLRHDVVLVVGAESGHGGLADSESEAEKPPGKEVEKWWLREDRVGRGRGVIVVDSIRVHDDWVRRVQGRD